MTRIAGAISGSLGILNGTALAAGFYPSHAGTAFRVLAATGLFVCGVMLLALAVMPRKAA